MNYKKTLKTLIDDIYLHWQGSWPEFAAAAGVSYRTVYLLGTYQTKSPHLRTILKLAEAAQMKVSFDFSKILRKAA